MTILDAFNHLNEYFNEHHCLNINDDFKKLVKITVTEDQDMAAIKAALIEMEKSGVVRKAEVNGKEFWVLFKPFENFSQDVEINYLLAAGISGVINKVCDLLENDSDRCDPKEITEKDIKNLIFIASKVSVENLKN
jgi:hypothetical protein